MTAPIPTPEPPEDPWDDTLPHLWHPRPEVGHVMPVDELGGA